jgi:co-chaperonin GroES (HSP10)
MPFMPMQHDEDPAHTINKVVADVLPHIHIYGNYILLGIYIRPEKTKTGIILTNHTRDEDKHQGKAALVLKKGPTAFVSDHNYDFQGQDVKVGDWVSVWVSDGRQVTVNGQLCRLVEDQHIRMKIPAPDLVF